MSTLEAATVSPSPVETRQPLTREPVRVLADAFRSCAGREDILLTPEKFPGAYEAVADIADEVVAILSEISPAYVAASPVLRSEERRVGKECA